MRGDQKLSSCWVYTFKRCDVIHLSAATPSTSPLFLVLLSLIFLVFGFLSFWLSHTSLWKPGDSVLPNQRISAHQHTCHVLCICVSLALKWLLFSPLASPRSPCSLWYLWGVDRGHSSPSCPSAPSHLLLHLHYPWNELFLRLMSQKYRSTGESKAT